MPSAERAVPIQQLPLSGAEPPTIWLQKMADMANGENPETNGKNYLQDQDIYFKTFDEYYMDKPVKFATVMERYLEDNYDKMLSLFRLVRNRALLYIQQTLKTRLDPVQIGTDKTDGREISYTVSEKTGHPIFTQEGAIFDRSALLTPMGRADFDAKMMRLKLDHLRAMIFAITYVFQTTPDAYQTPEWIYGNDHVPKTILQLNHLMQKRLFAVNKSPYGVENIVENGDLTFLQSGNNRKTEGIMFTRQFAYYVHHMNEVNVRFDKSGRSAQSFKRMIHMPGSIGDVELYGYPQIDQDYHNSSDDTLPYRPFSAGTWAPYRSNTRKRDASEYRSFQRDIWYVDRKSNTWVLYRYIDHIRNWLQFMPFDQRPFSRYKNHGGKLNLAVLNNLIKLAKIDVLSNNNIFTATGVVMQGNEQRLDPFIRYVKPAAAAEKATWMPIYFLGQIPEEQAKTTLLLHSYQTMTHALMHRMTEGERRAFEHFMEDDIRETEDWAPFKLAVRKYVLNLKIISWNNPFSVQLIPILESLLTKNSLTVARAAFSAAYTELLKQFIGQYSEKEWRKAGMSMPGVWTAADLANAGTMTGFKTARDAFINHIKQSAFFVPDAAVVLDVGLDLLRGDDELIPEIHTRAAHALSLAGPLQLSALIYNYQPMAFQTFESHYERNVDICMGGANARPGERQITESILLLGDRMMGDLNFSGIEVGMSQNTTKKEYTVGMSSHFGAMIDDPEKFFWYEHARGCSDLGGKDSGYLTQTDVMDCKGEFTQIQHMMHNGKSNIPIAGCLNDAVMWERLSPIVDLRGYFPQSSYSHRMHYSTDFNTRQHYPMYSGVFLINAVYGFCKITLNNDPEPQKQNFVERIARHDLNFQCNLGSIKIWDPATRYHVTQSYHVWGEQLPGMREKETSYVPVTQNTLPSRKRLANVPTASGFVASRKRGYNQIADVSASASAPLVAY